MKIENLTIKNIKFKIIAPSLTPEQIEDINLYFILKNYDSHTTQIFMSELKSYSTLSSSDDFPTLWDLDNHNIDYRAEKIFLDGSEEIEQKGIVSVLDKANPKQSFITKMNVDLMHLVSQRLEPFTKTNPSLDHKGLDNYTTSIVQSSLEAVIYESQKFYPHQFAKLLDLISHVDPQMSKVVSEHTMWIASQVEKEMLEGTIIASPQNNDASSKI